MLRRLTCYLAILASLGAAVPVRAADDDSGRREAFARGRSAISDERWRDALGIFQKLWTDRRSFDVGLQLGLVELNLRKYRDAAEHLAFGIRNLPPKEPKTTEDRARKLLALAEREVFALEIYVDRSNIEIRIDGTSVGRSPLDGDTYLDPGSHQIEAIVEASAPLQQSVIAKAGERQRIVFDTAKAPPAPDAVPAAAPTAAAAPTQAPPTAALPPQQAKHSKNLTPVYIASAAAVVALGVGTSLVVIGANKNSEKDDALAALPGDMPCKTGTDYPNECEEIKDMATKARSLRTAGFVSVGVGVAAVVTAVYLFTDANSSTARAPQRRLLAAPLVGSHEIGAILHGDF